MTRMATDVVLLPDEAAMDRVIEINRQLVREYGSEIVLSRRGCLPHVSLAMGCIEEDDLDANRKTLEQLARENPLRQLTATGILTSADSQGRVTSLLEVERTVELQTLHERVMEEMERVFSHDVTDVSFYDAAVAETTLDWVRSYPQKAAHGRFSPHVTLGYGRAKPGFSFPFAFGVTRLALCHLGNHATCRKVLSAVNL